MTITELAQALRRRETSASALAERALARAHELNPDLNAFVLIDDEGARAAAHLADEQLAAGIDLGPLHGIPVAVKDLIDMAGLPTTCGSATTFGRKATEDAEVVRRLRKAGAVIIGKTTLHEFAYGATGDRSAHGPSRNPIDPSRMSGGSSGGSAVAVGAGIVPLALGTDTAGSVRVPAALCGVVGFKPAYDTVSPLGVYPLAPSLDHVGIFTATAGDAWTAYRALTDTPADYPVAPQRIAVGWIPPRAIADTDRRIEKRTRQLVDGAFDVVDLADRFSARNIFEVFSTLQGREAFQVHEDHLAAEGDLIDPEVRARLEKGREISDGRYAQAEAARDDFRIAVDKLLSMHPVLALPTVPVTAPRLGERQVSVDGTDLEVRAALLSLTNLWNMSGSPAISVPAGLLDGLPTAVQLVTAPGNEGLLFAAAQLLEAHRSAH